MDVTISQSRVEGRVRAPPSKSYTHRAILAAGYGDEAVVTEACTEHRDARDLRAGDTRGVSPREPGQPLAVRAGHRREVREIAIGVDDYRFTAPSGCGRGDAERRGRLADSSLSAGDGEHAAVGVGSLFERSQRAAPRRPDDGDGSGD